MTDLLYQTDAYLKEFSATVTSINAEEKGVLLARTVFFRVEEVSRMIPEN